MKKVSVAVIYVIAIISVNYGFSHIPVWHLFGEILPPMTFLVGVIFVIRDFAQRTMGHLVVVPMVVGLVLSYFMADPFIATASAAAFAVSEVTDWVVFTVTKWRLKDRILISSAFAVPLDSAVFLVVSGFFSFPGFLIMVASKIFASIIAWVWIK